MPRTSAVTARRSRRSAATRATTTRGCARRPARRSIADPLARTVRRGARLRRRRARPADPRRLLPAYDAATTCTSTRPATRRSPARSRSGCFTDARQNVRTLRCDVDHGRVCVCARTPAAHVSHSFARSRVRGSPPPCPPEHAALALSLCLEEAGIWARTSDAPACRGMKIVLGELLSGLDRTVG